MFRGQLVSLSPTTTELDKPVTVNLLVDLIPWDVLNTEGVQQHLRHTAWSLDACPNDHMYVSILTLEFSIYQDEGEGI